MGLLSLEETEKAGPDAELTAVSSNTPWQETPPQKQSAGQDCAQSHQGLCHEGWSNPSAQPRTEAWRREVKGGGAPCMEEGTVKRELWFASPAPGDHLYSLAPFAGRADS